MAFLTRVDVNDETVALVGVNSSWMSDLHDRQGCLLFQPDWFDPIEAWIYQNEPDLVVSAIHHPIHWQQEGLLYEIYAKAKRWDMATEVANALTRLTPESPASWICLAYSTRRKSAGGIPQAKEILLGAVPHFPKEFLFPYNLACYCSQLSQFEEAQVWFKKAMAIDEKSVKRIALEYPDLKPLWDSMGGTMWKRE